MFIKFNAPPRHVFRSKIVPELAKEMCKTTSFERKDKLQRFKYEGVSAAIGNFRKNEENNSNVPIDFFE